MQIAVLMHKMRVEVSVIDFLSRHLVIMSLIMKAVAIIESAPLNFGVIALEIWMAVYWAPLMFLLLTYFPTNV